MHKIGKYLSLIRDSVWTAVLTVREHLTECLKNAIKPHQVNIGKTKDEMGKGIEVGNSKI